MALLNSIIWNGKSIRDFGAEITDVKGRGKPEVRRKSLSIQGRHGELTFGTKYLPRRIELDGYVEGASHTTLLGDIDNIKNLFSMRDSIEALGNEQLSDTDLYGKLEFGDQTDRHYRAQYDGIFGLRDISARWMKNDFIRFGVRFLCTDPFAYDNTLTEVTMTPSADAFKVYDTGTHYSECDIDIHGAVTNPVIVSGDKVGVAHFDNDDDLRNVENVNVAGNFAAAFGYRTRKSLTENPSKAIQLVNRDNLHYDRGTVVNNQNFANFNPYQGTMIFWVKPYFDGDDRLNHMIFIELGDANDYVFLEKTSGNLLRFEVSHNGTVVNADIAVTSANFGAGTWHFIACRFDRNNTIDGTNFVAIKLNAAEDEDSTALGTPAAVDATLSIGQDEGLDSGKIFDGLIFWHFFERALTDSEVTTLFNSGAGVDPKATPDTKLLSAGELSSGDPVSVQYPWIDNEFTDGDQENDPSTEWTDNGTGGSGVNTAVTNEATIVKYDLQSAQLDWDAAASGEYAFRSTAALVDNDDYFYRVWVRIDTLNASDEIHLDIVGNSTVHTRRIDGVEDDLNIAFALGTWHYLEGVFNADGAVAHEFRLRKVNANGNATMYIDQMDCQVNPLSSVSSPFVNGAMGGTYFGGTGAEIPESWASLNATKFVGTKETVDTRGGGDAWKAVVSASAGGIDFKSTYTSGRWYLISWWAKVTAGNISKWGLDSLRAGSTATFEGDTALVNADVIPGNDWNKYYLLVKCTFTDTKELVFLGEAGCTMLIDNAVIIELDTVTANAASKATAEAISFSPAKYGQGLRIDGGDTLSWAMVGNKNEGSIIAWIEPQFDADWADDTDDPVIVELQQGAVNFFQMFYDWTNDQWVFRKNRTSNHDAVSAAQTFVIGDRICLIGTYDTVNGTQIYINGVAGTINTNLIAIGGNPTQLSMGNNAGTIFPDSVIDELYVLSRALSAQEALAFFNNPRASKLDNRVFGITRTYAANDKVIIRTEPETLEFADESADTIANDISSMNSGSQFPRLAANKAVVYNKVAATDIKINYRKRWL